MSKDLFFRFLKGSTLFEDYDMRLSKLNSYGDPKHLSCKGLYGKPIPVPPESVSNSIIQEINSCISISNFNTEIIKDRRLRQEVIILLEKLTLWEQYCLDNSLKTHLSKEIIFRRNILEGPDFADYLKDVFSYSIRKTIGEDYSEPYGQEVFEFEDINQIFPHQHLINFIRNKDLSDMLDYAFKEPKISIDISYKLRNTIEKNILKNKNLRYFDYLDLCTNMDEKGSFTKNVNTFSSKGSTEPTFNGLVNELVFRVESIHKTPSESRTIAIAEDSCKDFLSYTRKLYSGLLNSKYDYYGKSRWSFEKKLHQRLNTMHLLFDQKKSGWTFPMEYIEILFDILSQNYPEIPQFKRMHQIFETRQIFYLFDDKKARPLRGFTLGMFDDAMSFIISCLFEIFLEDNELEFEDIDHIDGLFFGDDCDIIVRGKIGDIQYVSNKWLVFLDRLGIYANIKKSFYSPSGIFCEVYGLNNTVQMRKHLVYMMNGFNILKCYNTAHAKNIFNGYYRNIKMYFEYLPSEQTKNLEKYLQKVTSIVISSFPYEFVENEFQFPFEVGGWVQHLEGGYNLLFQEYIEGKIHKSFQQVYCVKFPKFSIDNVPHTIKKEYEEILKNPFWWNFNLVLNHQEFDNKEVFFERFINSKKRSNLVEKQWWKYQFKRQKAFNCKISLSTGFDQEMWSVPFIKMKMVPEMFNEDWSNQSYIASLCSRKPDFMQHKTKVYIDKYRSLDLLRDPEWLTGYLFKTRYIRQVDISDITASLDTNLSSCKYIVPTEWYRLCLEWDISFEKIYHMMNEQGFDPFHYKPKLYKKDKIGVIDKIFDLTKEFIMFSSFHGEYLSLDAADVIDLEADINSTRNDEILSRNFGLSLYEYQNFKENMLNIHSLTAEIIFDEWDVLVTEEELKRLESEGLILGKPEKIIVAKGGEVAPEDTLEYVAPKAALVTSFEDLDDPDYEDSESEKENFSDEDDPDNVDYYKMWLESAEHDEDVLQNRPDYLYNVDKEDYDGFSSDDGIT